jgi:GMP synthase (glutamine-hydrolysing)
LFKDEVRRARAASSGLPDAFVGRHPFPGPGPRDPRARRDHPREARHLRKADAIYLEEIRLAGLYDEIWQAFAVLCP